MLDKPPSRRLLSLLTLCLAVASGCTIKVAGTETAGRSGADSDLGGKILIDGSSTVYPVTQAMAEEFSHLNPRVQIPVGSGGTSSGFKKLIQGEIDIAGASRPITEKELEELKSKGRDALELQVALDGISIVVHKSNDWCTALSMKQLHELWKAEGHARTWKDLNPAWPGTEIKLFGAGTNSGTFEYFTEVVNGKKGSSRSDYSQSEDDNQLVTGVCSDKSSLGYFGYSYFDENRDRLQVVRIAAGDDLSAAVEPTRESIEDGRYTPLARPVFIYVNRQALKRPEVVAFLRYYLSDEGQKLVSTAHCINLNSAQLDEQRRRLEEAVGALSVASN